MPTELDEGLDHEVEHPDSSDADLPDGTEDTESDGGVETVTLTIDGEDVEVTLEEMAKSYLRQSDYTKKTQEVATLRKEAERALNLQRALEANPREAIAALASHFGVSFADNVEDDSYDDPQAERIRELERKLASLEARDRQDSVEREVQTLLSKYEDEDIDVEAVMRHAIDHGFPSLEAAYKDMAFDAYFPAFKQTVKKRVADDSVIKVKRKAAVINAGSSAGAAGDLRELVDVPKGKRLSVREAYELARDGKTVPQWRPKR
jgi:hypothetical protein